MFHSGMKWSCFIWKGVLWSTLCLARLWRVKHTKVWSGTAYHEAHLRCMTQSLFRLHSPFLQSKNGGADVDYYALKFSSKNAVNPSFTLNFGTLWHNVTRLPASIFWGINGENHRLRGKNGEFWMPSSQSPNGNQTIIPIDLETLKYSRNLPYFKSNGEIPGKKIPSPRPIM